MDISILNFGIKQYLNFRYRRILSMYKDPHLLQMQILEKLVYKAQNTEWGRKFDYKNIRNPKDYRKRVGISEYEDLSSYIERMMKGEQDILCRGKVSWYAKSSGTTNDRSKYIPVPDEMMNDNLISSSWDSLSILYNNRPDSKLFAQKSLLIGGTIKEYEAYPESKIGDVSAIMLHRMPAIGRPFYTPDLDTAILDDFELKLEKMARITSKERVTMLGGVPTWIVVLLNRILELTGKSNMTEVWPEARLFMHGGVGFEPYREQFKEYFPREDFDFMEIYNASEGYFAIQDDFDEDGMLLLLDNGIYYEFIPVEEYYSENPQALDLREVETGKQYVLVISACSGLSRYVPGDTIEFVSINPYKIKVSGRTKQYINVFGEELMVANTDKALAFTCNMTQSIVNDYTVAPIFLDKANKGGHEWLIEFAKTPDDINAFGKILDDKLRELNSDYDAKRYNDMALETLKIKELPTGAFKNWLKKKGKMGSQVKVPRLSNNRKYVDQLLELYQN